MLRRVVKDDAVTLVAQKGCPARLALQDARFPFHAQANVQTRLLGHQAHQPLRLMDVQIVHHKPPACRWRLTHDHLLHMCYEIRFRPRWPQERGNNLARHHVATQDTRTGAMPDVLKFAARDLARCQRQARMLALQRLHPGQFIRAHRAFALLRTGWCLTIDRTDGADCLRQVLIRGRGQPVAAQLRLEIPFLSRRAAWRSEIFGTMPRLITSSAISRPVHWEIGRPASLGASQARATIWQRCCAVIWMGRPARGTSLRRSSKERSASGMGAKASQRMRQRRTVSKSRVRGRALWGLLAPSAAAWMMRARRESCCGSEWRRSRASSCWRTSAESSTAGGFGPRIATTHNSRERPIDVPNSTAILEPKCTSLVARRGCETTVPTFCANCAPS